MATLSEHGLKVVLSKLFEHVQGLDESWRISENSSSFPGGDTENLDKEACRLDAIICAFDEAAKKHVVNIRRRRNQLVPIYRFPPEVLSLIIESAIDVGAESEYEAVSEMYHKYYHEVGRLGGVSSFFHTTVVSNPHFWTKIDGDSHPLFLELILQRSKNTPLDINIECKRGPFPNRRCGGTFRNKNLNEDMFPRTLEYCSRWRSLRMSSSGIQGSQCPMLPESPLPLLESFEIRRYDPIFHELTAWVRQRAPKLSHLDIAQLSFPLGCNSLTTLKSIRMTSAILGVALSTSQWYSFLSSSPQLKSIIAYGPGGLYLHSQESWVNEIHMPHLVNLELRHQPLNLVGSLLRSIIPAQNSYPHIVIEANDYIRDDEWIDYFPESPPDGSLLSKIIRRIEWIETPLGGPPGLNMLLKGGVNGTGQSVEIHVPNTKPDVSQILLPSFGAPFLVSAEINGSHFFEGGYIISGIRFCSRLEHLVLNVAGIGREEQNRLSQLCTVLATPVQPNIGSGVGSWPCPNLRRLEICTTTKHFPFVLQLIKTRYGAIKGAGQPPPVFLEKLQLRRLGATVDIRSQSSGPVKQLENILKCHGTILMLE